MDFCAVCGAGREPGIEGEKEKKGGKGGIGGKEEKWGGGKRRKREKI